jgi:acyl CoA:acetate/3-ketoacid CoA transferase beta subunit
MRLESIHRGVTLSNIQENTGINLILPKKIPLTKPPSPDQLNILRKIEKKH